MNTKLITLFFVLTLAVTARAESTVTLTGVHNCCKSCANGITKAVTSVKGATAACDKGTVTITAKTQTDAKKAATALLAAGYFGEGAPAPSASAASAAKTKSVTVEGPHLCCGKCVKDFNEAVKAGGATGTNAAKGATSVIVDGDVSPKDVLAALNKAGFNGKVK